MDYEIYGESYWHRTHQLPGVFVCPHHSVFLENSGVRCTYQTRRGTLITARKEIKKTTAKYLDSDNSDHLSHLYLAEQGYWLLNQSNLMNYGPDFFRKRFLQKLFERNLASINGTVRITKLEKEIVEYFSKDFLSLLSSSLEGKCTWLRRLVQTSTHFQHPIRNLLLLDFLQISLEKFLELSGVSFPFGKPPFPCLNPASDHYKDLRIGNLSIKKMFHRESGLSATFECDCGFTYRRFNYYDDAERTYEYDSIISFGDVFIKKLLDLKNKELSAHQIGLALNISESTVKLQLKKLYKENNILLTDSSLEQLQIDDINKKRDSHRSKWKKLQQTNPKLNRTQLRKLNPKIGNWLYVHDMTWLNENSPPRQIIKGRKYRIDWKNKDKELSIKTKNLALELLNSSDKPIRVSTTCLAKRLNFHYLVIKRPECIPNTIKTLKKYAETTEDFIARRIYHTAECFINEKKAATYWQLIMRANVLAPHLIQLSKVQKAIEESLIKIDKFRNLGWKTQ